MSEFMKCPVFSLYTSFHKLIRVYTKYLEELELTYPQYLVLSFLMRKDERSVDDIGRSLFLDSETLTPLLKRLELQELVTRTHSQEDERKKNIQITRKGQLLESKFKTLRIKIRKQFEISEKEIEELIRILSKI